MNWQDDPELQKERYHAGVRSRLLRSILIWGPPFLIALGAFVFFTYDRAVLGGENGGTWFLVIILGVLSLLFGFQAIQSLLDYVGKPVKLTGQVTRRWARSDSFVIKTHYIRVGKMILRGDQLVLDGIKEGDRVEATYYPKSAVLVWVDKLPPPPEPEGDAALPLD
jgi:hypothetical protein